MERTHSWLDRFRRLLIRWEKKADNYLAMLHLACAWITYHATKLFGKVLSVPIFFPADVKNIELTVQKPEVAIAAVSPTMYRSTSTPRSQPSQLIMATRGSVNLSADEV